MASSLRKNGWTRPKTRDEVLALAQEQKIRFILLQFTDILGVAKNVAVPVEQLGAALNGEIMFDGSSVQGFVRIEESDMLLFPDPTTYMPFPWLNSERGNTARLICDILKPNGEPFEGCPRTTLKRAVAEAAALGYTMNAGPEAEFFLFPSDEEGRPVLRSHDQGGYFDLSPVDRGEEARRDMVMTLEDVGFDIESAHHEVAPAQHEIDFRYAEAVATADNVMTFKIVVRTVARQHGLHATFMPKPVYGIAGSGMHIHQSLFQGERNAFHNPAAPNGLSQVCLHYMAGLLHHARAFTAITNPLVNSYKRLVPGFEAPVYIAWSERNRSPLIRIPDRRGTGTRIELRSPDPSSNPYLALAVILQAGLDGIRRQLIPPAPVNRNIYEMTQEEREQHGIASLPGRLEEALEELQASVVVREALGQHIMEYFVEAKRIEAELYRTHVHNWEVERYLEVY
ncbi:MAG: type I glutamate--ammonia ligase [Bacillota bacterium]